MTDALAKTRKVSARGSVKMKETMVWESFSFNMEESWEVEGSPAAEKRALRWVWIVAMIGDVGTIV